MNRWLIPFLVIGLVSTIALLTLAPHSGSIRITDPSHTTVTRTETRSPAQPHAFPIKTPRPSHAAASLTSQPTAGQTERPTMRPQSLVQGLTPTTTMNSGTGQPLAPATLVTSLADLINQQRRRYGITPLTIVPALTVAAYQHSVDMATQNTPAHQGSDGSSGGGRMLAAGYHWQTWAEVIGWGFADPASMVTWWLNDAEHRTILLSPAFTEFGIGYATLGNTLWQNYWTVNFGRPVINDLNSGQGVTPTSSATAEAIMTQPPISPAPTTVVTDCPATSTQSYALIPMEGVDLSHPAAIHGDLNLAQRGYTPVASQPQLIDLAGPVDPDAPQLAQLFGRNQPIRLKSLYQVMDWQWGCGEHGCRGIPLTTPAVTMLGLQTQAGATLYTPARQASIYRDLPGEAYLAVVLYAEVNRLTLAYTRDGSVANGYVIHVEQVCVDPHLLQQYRTADAHGRQQLPALQHQQAFGTAAGNEVRVAIRDRGTFLDPRSRKDWWQED